MTKQDFGAYIQALVALSKARAMEHIGQSKLTVGSAVARYC